MPAYVKVGIELIWSQVPNANLTIESGFGIRYPMPSLPSNNIRKSVKNKWYYRGLAWFGALCQPMVRLASSPFGPGYPMPILPLSQVLALSTQCHLNHQIVLGNWVKQLKLLRISLILSPIKAQCQLMVRLALSQFGPGYPVPIKPFSRVWHRYPKPS